VWEGRAERLCDVQLEEDEGGGQASVQSQKKPKFDFSFLFKKQVKKVSQSQYPYFITIFFYKTVFSCSFK
jgi:hypothetical protein